jgi:hypothetical protein
MKVIKTKNYSQKEYQEFMKSNNIITADYKDIEGLIEGISDKLKEFGLEIVYYDDESDEYIVQIRKIKRKNAK